MEILIIGRLWPEPNSSAAGKRMMQLIQLFQQLGIVHFSCPASKTGNEENLEILGIKTHDIKLNDNSFNKFIAAIQPSIVVFDRFIMEEQFSWRVVETCPNALRILDTEDLHFLRNARKSGLKSTKEIDLFSEDAMRELAAISRSDLNLIISHVEFELLEHTFQVPKHLLYYLPIFSEGMHSTIPPFEEREDAIFIGNFLHEPNIDAVRYLKKELWPLVKSKMKAVNVHIYGAYPTKEVLDFNNIQEGFIVHGRCNDPIAATKKSRLSFAPLRFGAGIKGKLIEAMECGTPSITTSIGCEGITFAPNWPGIVADSTEELAEAFIQLYSNKNEWLTKQKKAEELLTSFQIENYGTHFLDKMVELLSNIEVHRSEHYISKLLWHQTLQGSKYMSKWIMEKNKDSKAI